MMKRRVNKGYTTQPVPGFSKQRMWIPLMLAQGA
jgi:hypothetical protein